MINIKKKSRIYCFATKGTEPALLNYLSQLLARTQHLNSAIYWGIMTARGQIIFDLSKRTLNNHAGKK